MESWIDSIKDVQTSTPMVALVKLDMNAATNNRMTYPGNCGGGDDVGKCDGASGSCKCSGCVEARDVAGRLFDLTLSDDDNEGAKNGRTTSTRRTNVRTVSKSKPVNLVAETVASSSSDGERRKCLRSRKTSVKDTTDEDEDVESSSSDVTSRGGRHGSRNRQQQRTVNRRDTTSDDDGNGVAEEEPRRTRRGLRNRQTSVNYKDVTDESSCSATAVSEGDCIPRTTLRSRQKSVVCKDTTNESSSTAVSDEDRNHRTRLRSRQKSANYKDATDEGSTTAASEEDCNHGTRVGLRNRRHNSDNSSDNNLEGTERATRGRTRQNNLKSDKEHHQVESDRSNCSVVLHNLSSVDITSNLKGPAVVMKSLSVTDISPHLRGSSVVMTTGMSPIELGNHLGDFSHQATRRSHNSTNSGDSPLSSGLNQSEGSSTTRSLNGSGSSSLSLSLHPLSKKLLDLHLSSDADVEDAGELDREEEEREGSDEPMCPHTPRNQRLASFHTDSFKVCIVRCACQCVSLCLFDWLSLSICTTVNSICIFS